MKRLLSADAGCVKMGVSAERLNVTGAIALGHPGVQRRAVYDPPC